MDAVSHAFVAKSRALLCAEYPSKIHQCLDAVSARDVWWRPNDASNSIGNLMLHLCGNVTMWIVGGVGKLPFERHRQLEFDERRPLPTADLRARMSAVIGAADAVLAGLRAEDLMERRQIQGYDVTVLEAVYHVVEHFGMHTGQIIFLAKARAGRDLELWAPPPPPVP